MSACDNCAALRRERDVARARAARAERALGALVARMTTSTEAKDKGGGNTKDMGVGKSKDKGGGKIRSFQQRLDRLLQALPPAPPTPNPATSSTTPHPTAPDPTTSSAVRSSRSRSRSDEAFRRTLVPRVPDRQLTSEDEGEFWVRDSGEDDDDGDTSGLSDGAFRGH